MAFAKIQKQINIANQVRKFIIEFTGSTSWYLDCDLVFS